MPRAKDATSARLSRRKEVLKKKAQELATRCDVEVAVVCDARGDRLVWPSNQAVMATARRYNALPREEREKYLEDHADNLAVRLEVELDKLVRAQEHGVAGTLGSWDGSLEGMSVEELREVLATIDGSLAVARSRHADEDTAWTPVPVRARSASSGARQRRGEADADGDVLAPPLEENPTKAPNAAPLVADQVTAEDPVSAPARGAGNVVRRRLCEVDAGADALELPQEANPGTPNASAPMVADDAAEGGDESEDAQILPVPGDADADADDAEWMRDLVEALKETSPPPNAAPYWSETEYLYVGGGAIERDAYDFICFDLGMPPPYIGPDSPDSDDEEPLKLWSWE